MTSDPLVELLAEEIQRHLDRLGPEPTPDQLRTVLHSVKGSAGLVRYHDLALVASQLGARLRAGDEQARRVAVPLLSRVAERLRAGLTPFEPQWPLPPPELLPSEVNPEFYADYVAVMNDRLLEIDDALDRGDPWGSLDNAYRTVHAMKTAAASAGDEVTAWYCHGLETRLRQVPRTETAARAALGDLSRHRAVLAQLLDQPARALDTLRALEPTRRPTPPPPPPTAHLIAPADADAVLRVPSTVLDTILEQLDRSNLVRDELLRAAAATRLLAGELRDLRVDVLDGLHELGSRDLALTAAYQRVEHAARALAKVAERVDNVALTNRRNAESIYTNALELRGEVAALRRTTALWLFNRVRRATHNLTPVGYEVNVKTAGADLALDRRTADALLEPVLQLVRNAVAHGLESPAERREAGKPEAGTIFLCAERLAEWIRITVTDDGRGADLSKIKLIAEQRGGLGPTPETLEAEDDLLALLFLPGFTTREGADVLGGRGVGLELAQDAVRALGGGIRLAMRPGGGLSATVEVPAERGLADVLWIVVASTSLAIPASFVESVSAHADTSNSISLAHLLGLTATNPPLLAVQLKTHGMQPVALGVDAAAHVEQVLIRPVPPLVAAAGPYNGAVLRSDGSLNLVLDPNIVAAQAWARIT